MRRHLLSTLVGLCMLGLAAPTWAVPMSATLSGEVTSIILPDFALDWEVGTPATMTATWDTDDFVALVGFEPGFFRIRTGGNANASLTVTVGSHTWVETDDIFFGETNPFLIFDAEGDFLGAHFNGENSAGEFFFTAVLNHLVAHVPPGVFFASSDTIFFPPGGIGVAGQFAVPDWDGNFPVPAAPVPEPGTLALLGLGLAGLGVARRRRAN